jgi:hypothetical protein
MTLISMRGIADLFEVSHSCALKWRERYPDFPPVSKIEIVHHMSDPRGTQRKVSYTVPLYDKSAVLDWATEAGRWDALVGIPIRRRRRKEAS